MERVVWLLVATVVIIYLIPSTNSYSSGSLHLYGCQGLNIPINPCGNVEEAVYDIRSITVITSSNVEHIQNVSSQCYRAEECRRTIHSAEDTGLNADYAYLYNWIYNRCNGKRTCEENSKMPEWWALTDDTTACGQGRTQHFVGALMDVTCRVGEVIPTVGAPSETTPKTRPTTPSTTTSFPVFIPVYVPELIGREKVILGVAIGLAIAILIVLLIVLYCCERYRHHKKFGKLLRMLGAPQAQSDGFDDFEDYGKSDAWREETNANLDALGEYTGVKPDEFLTLDKRTMESTGQIMYDSSMHTMTMGRGNSCTTLSREGRVSISSHPSGTAANNLPRYSIDYETEENLELERRMAATLYQDNRMVSRDDASPKAGRGMDNKALQLEEDISYH